MKEEKISLKMKLTLWMTGVLILATVFLLVLMSALLRAEEMPQLVSDKDKVSYMIGVETARNIKRSGIEVGTDQVAMGLKDVFSGNKLLMSDSELQTMMTTMRAEMKQKQMATLKKAGEENKNKGDAFLSGNKTREGIVTLPDGLQYQIVKMGGGKIPTESDTVECNYRGTLVDGTEFDSSYSSGHAATFPVNGVIPGWREALKMMPEGSTWRLFIPPHLAYGERGAGNAIGPNATLVFDVELLSVK